jgi:hypothetical protein
LGKTRRSAGGPSSAGAKTGDRTGAQLRQAEHAASEDLTTEALEVALLWERAYVQLVDLEEKLLMKVRDLLPGLSLVARQEVELTNIPMLLQHLQAFKDRRALWHRRVRELGGGPASAKSR